MAYLKGTLHGADYSDKFKKDLKPGKYEYTLAAKGKGRVAFSVRACYVRDGESRAKWGTIERKVKVRAGKTIRGSFTVPDYYPPGTHFANPKIYPSSDYDPRPEKTRVEFKLQRPFLGRKSSYRLDYDRSGG